MSGTGGRGHGRGGPGGPGTPSLPSLISLAGLRGCSASRGGSAVAPFSSHPTRRRKNPASSCGTKGSFKYLALFPQQFSAPGLFPGATEGGEGEQSEPPRLPAAFAVSFFFYLSRRRRPRAGAKAAPRRRWRRGDETHTLQGSERREEAARTREGGASLTKDTQDRPRPPRLFIVEFPVCSFVLFFGILFIVRCEVAGWGGGAV